MAFREVGGGDVHKMEEGQKITGWLIEVLHDQGMKGNSTIITLEKEDGNRVSVWGSTVLDDKIASCTPGDFVQIEHLGKKKNKSGTNEFNDFRLLVDDENKRSMGNQTQEEPAEPKVVMTEDSGPSDGGEKMPWD